MQLKSTSDSSKSSISQ